MNSNKKCGTTAGSQILPYVVSEYASEMVNKRQYGEDLRNYFQIDVTGVIWFDFIANENGNQP